MSSDGGDAGGTLPDSNPTLQLGRIEVHLSEVSLAMYDHAARYLYSLLSPEERSRADRHLQAKSRLRFVAGRGMLRVIGESLSFAERRGLVAKGHLPGMGLNRRRR